MKKLITVSAVILFFYSTLYAQKEVRGIISGNLIDESKKAIPDVTVQLISIEKNNSVRSVVSDKNGFFQFIEIPFSFYKLKFTHTGLQTLEIDSIHFREERFDFNLNDIMLKQLKENELKEVIIYAEKPLVESKEGNITFNAGESAIAAGSSLGELLNSVPLVTKDPDGKILLRGKEPRILVDDKPVELNLQQLQDLLESMPGSSIEKIEVMTNPPAQYANEQGGVINIVTKKGKVGMGGRLAISGGTRGEGSINGSFNYRKNKFSMNFNMGAGLNRFITEGSSIRKNTYSDSTNHLNTISNSLNKNTRPNMRLVLDYELKKNHQLNFVFNKNLNDFNNNSMTRYINLNRFDQVYKLSERNINSDGLGNNTSFNLTYSIKGKAAGEQFRILAGANFSRNDNDRLYFQQFFNPDHSPNGIDSTQLQLNDTRSNGFNTRISYDKPLIPGKTFLSVGSAYNRSNSHVLVDASYKKKPEGVYHTLDLLSNDFKFHQDILNFRASVKQVLAKMFSMTSGLAVEATTIGFELLKDNRNVNNHYWNYLPFANINKNWNDKFSITLAYRRTIRRPGINELNPAIDFSDPYNVRFGNYQLEPSLTHDFNLVFSRTRPKYFLNLGMGYNIVEDVFSQIRTLLPEGKTQITWENISGRKEYEISSWNGYTVSNKIKINFSTTYTYFVYSEFDKTVRKFRNGGSFISNFSSNYTMKEVMNFTGSFNLNRFANPQGSVSWNLGMNLGVQRKFLNKRFIVTINVIDPFRDQKTNRFTYGKNFEVSSYNKTLTRNYKISLAYNFIKIAKKKPGIQNLIKKT